MALTTSSTDAVPQWVRSRLACPSCHSSLTWLDGYCQCSKCRSEFAIKDGIPILLPHDQEPDESARHKTQQAEFFDSNTDDAFEISRPRGTTRLYQWCIRRKFQFALDGLESALPAAVVLTVCGGSGMDAEHIASCGSMVISSDLSFEAARRTKERARRSGGSIYSIVADAERLPFAEQAVDIAFVHDGLHHLEDPSIGLREMGRVAKVAISVSEPARALGTALAVRLGLADEIEESGNRVNRLTLGDITQTLREAGFASVGAQRYLLVYRHVPGRASKLLSSRPLFVVTKPVLRTADAAVGRWGNKLSVRARRA